MIDDIIAVALIVFISVWASMTLNSFINDNNAMASELIDHYKAVNNDRIKLLEEKQGRSSIIIYYFIIENNDAPIIVDKNEYKKEDFDFKLNFNWKVLGFGKEIEVQNK